MDFIQFSQLLLEKILVLEKILIALRGCVARTKGSLLITAAMLAVLVISLSNGLTAASASATTGKASAGENAFLQASMLVQQEQYSLAEPFLKQVIQTYGERSLLGQNATYMLMSVYGCEGRYEDALRESIMLLRLLKSSPKNSSPKNAAQNSLSTKLLPAASSSGQMYAGGGSSDATINSDEVLAQQQVFQAALHKESLIKSHLAGVQDPAAILALRGSLDDNRLRSQEAMSEFRAAYRLLSHEPKATPEVRLLVEEPFLIRLNRIDGLKPGEREQIAMLYGNRILADPAASPSQQRLALSLLDSMVLEPSLQSNLPDSPEVLALKKTLDALAVVTVRPGTANAQSSSSQSSSSQSVEVHHWVNDMRRRLTEHDVNMMLATAVAAEKTSDWIEASEAYQKVIQQADGVNDLAEQSESIDRMESQAKRSLPLMRSLYRLSEDSGTASQNSFLGIDHTVGGDWHGVLGTEAWALFAVHGDDLCGGPRLLDGSFSYRIRGGDPANQPRRWRDPAGYKTAPDKDVPLVDPTVSGERVLSFLDDNGENYASGAGPDLYLDMTIPAGRHLLSMPLHFSYPENQAATYGLYLMASASREDFSKTTSSNAPSSLDNIDGLRCLAYSFVSIKDAPGYVRLAVQGPAHYTLIVRRLTGYNTNIPAVFLDPDLRSVNPAVLSNELSTDEFAASGLPSYPGVEPGADSPTENSTDKLLRLAYRYNAACNNNAEGGSWSDIEALASPLSVDPTLKPAQRLVAALITWQARQRLPLQAGEMVDAFTRFVALRYGVSDQVSKDQPENALPNTLHYRLDALYALANQFRLTGNIRLAEVAQDMAWSIQVPPTKTLDPSAIAALNRPVPAQLVTQDLLVKSLLDTEIRPYLEPQTLWLWRGAGGPEPELIHIALDCNYAARRVAVLSRGLLTSDFSLLTMASPEKLLSSSEPLYPFSFNDLPAQRARIWVNQIGQEWGASINGLPANPWSVSLSGSRNSVSVNATPPQQENIQGNVLSQPIGNILYVSACLPLLGKAAFPSETLTDISGKANSPGDSERPMTRTCLLQPDQLETLSHAWLDLNLFPTANTSMEQLQASRWLQMIQVQFPDYPRLPHVAEMLTHLPSADPN